MSKNLINRYVWLVETICKAGRITFEEINQKWVEKFEEEKTQYHCALFTNGKLP